MYKVSSVSGHTVKTEKKNSSDKNVQRRKERVIQITILIQGRGPLYKKVRQPIHFVVVVVVFFVFFFTDVNIYHPALLLTTPDSFAIAVHRAHVIFSRIQVTCCGGLGASFLKVPITFRAQREILRTKSKE